MYWTLYTWEDLDDRAVAENLKRAREVWGRISQVLSADGVSPQVMSKFYLTIVQSVLLYGSETWVITHHLQQRLDAFHKKCAR